MVSARSAEDTAGHRLNSGVAEAPSVFVHIVTHNSAAYISLAVESAMAQRGYVPGENLFVTVTDNASHDSTREALETVHRPGFASRGPVPSPLAGEALGVARPTRPVSPASTGS